MKFDYLLVGGGTSACVLANQVLERKLGTVAIIESGGIPYGPRIFTPVRYTETFGTRWDFGLQTEPQPAIVNRCIAWPRGRMLGGSSGLNAMIYVPVNSNDLLSWPESWRFEKIAPAAQEIEKRLFEPVEPLPEIHPLSQCFLDALSEYNKCLGLGDSIEPIRYRQTQRNGRRYSAYSVFMKPMLGHSSLKLIDHAAASRIIFNNARATGVEYERDGETSLFEANKAVILTAGAIFSPVLLLRSGIGPRDQLSENMIDTRIELSGVGKNLQDHLIVPLVFESSKLPSLERKFSKTTRVDYVQKRSGPKTSNVAEVGAFMDSKSSTSFANLNFESSRVQLHFMPTHYLEYPTREYPTDAWTIGITQSNPKSRGEIRLSVDNKSKYQFAIDPKYLVDGQDLITLVEGVQRALAIAAQPTLAKVRGSMLIPKSRIGSESFEELTIERIEKFVRRYAMTLYHPVGTCAMGDDADSVVDSQLRVRGTENLYVADASVMPNLPTGNPQSFAMLIGYRMASLIAEW